MLTFVINLHPGIPGLALSEPFLYPQQKEEKLKILFPAEASLAQRIEQAGMEVRKTLERVGYVKWQAVFLISIDVRQQSPYRDSISAHMLLIRKLFLNSSRIPAKPNNTFIIALDQINEDDAIPAINASKIYRDCWELDTFGFIRTEGNFITSDRELQELDNMWRRIQLDSTIILNRGFAGLPLQKQEEIKQEVKNIADKADAILNERKLVADVYKTATAIDYIDAQTLQEIKTEFLKRLENTRNDPTRYANFSPSDTLKSCFAEQLGIFAIENDVFRLIRMPFQMSHDSVVQRSLLQLSFLLCLITDEEEAVKNLGKKNYTLKVDLNNPEMMQLIQVYREQLHNMETRLTNRINTPPSVALKMFQNTNCGCNEILDRVQSDIFTVGFLRENGDLARWNDWNKEVNKQLEDYSLQAKRKMQSCINKSFKSDADAVIADVADINTKAEDLNRQRQTFQDEAKQNFLTKAYEYDWNDFRQQQEGLLKPKLFSRPSVTELLWIVGISVVIFTLSFTNAAIRFEGGGVKFSYYSSVMVAMLLMCLLALLLAKRKHTKDIKRILQHVFDNAQMRRTDINNEFERQKTYLKSLCNLNVVRGNYELALKARDQQQETNLLLDFHRRNLQAHKSVANKLMALFNPDNRTITTNYNQPTPEPDITQPPLMNEVYMPATYIISKQDNNAAIVENINYPVNSRYARLISSITFDKDKIYARDTAFK
ncbi:hypothetical protein C7N43_08235 [Sphingobacteriales bacterium UPWRP_1]|nr:hypothetical protein B6N25_11170 [Sphingobacteriales bacterium TSM_CSS]PSJ77543.1 hypothetical protein C7N43_08235 [Sphingobacteriales bacterium UPWRP_1]